MPTGIRPLCAGILRVCYVFRKSTYLRKMIERVHQIAATGINAHTGKLLDNA